MFFVVPSMETRLWPGIKECSRRIRGPNKALLQTASIRVIPQMKLSILTSSIAALVILGGASSAFGGTVNLNGSGTSWGLTADWSSGLLPQPGDALLINGSSLTAGFTETLDASYSVQTLSFDTGSAVVNLNANANGTAIQTLTLTGGTDALGATVNLIDLSGATTGTVNIGVASGVGKTTVALGASGAINIGNASAVLDFGANSVISGAFNLSLTGAGTLVLAGANTFGGSSNTFTLGGGTLDINNATALGSASNKFVINGGAIDNTSGAAITTSNYAQSWAGDFTFNGSNALNLGSGAVTLSASRTVTVNGSGTNGVLTVAGGISGAGFGLTKAGTGTLVLTAQESFSGPVIVNNGTLTLSGPNNGAGTLGASSGITINNGGSVTFTSDNALTGYTNHVPILVNAGGTLAETNNSSAHIGGVLTLAGGTLASVATPTGNGLQYGTFNLDSGVVAGGVASTSVMSANDVALTQSGGTVFTVNSGASNGIDLDVPGTFYHSAGVGDTGLIKAGTGVMRLDGANTYTSNTKINAGTLALAGAASLASHSITVGPGGIFDVSALSSGGFSLASGQSLTAGKASGFGNDIVGNLSTGAGSLSVGGNGTAGTLTLNGNLTLNGGTVNLDLASGTTVGNGVNDLVTVGNLNLSGTTVFAFNTLNGFLTNGSYTLVTYSGSFTGSLSNLTATINGNSLSSVRGSYTFGTSASSGGALTLGVSGASASLVWVGNGASNVWDVKTTANFSNGGSADIFYQGDNVTFDDSGSNSPAIAVTGTVNPSSITINNSAKAYTFGGTGSIAGLGALTKSGNGVLTITNANSYAGGTTLNAGQLNINNASAIGTGALALAGGTIDNTSGASITMSTNNAQTWSSDFNFGGTNSLNLGTGAVSLTGNRTVTANGSGVLTVGGLISGAFNLSFAGSGTLALAGANTFGGSSNTFTLNGGTLDINSAAALGNAANKFIINGGAIDNTSSGGITTSNYAQTWAGDFTFNGSHPLNLGSGAVTLSASRTVTVNGTGTNGVLTVSGSISGAGFGITKAGAGTLVLTGQESFTGPVIVNNGTLTLSGPNNSVGALGACSGITVNNGGLVNVTSDNGLTGASATPILVNAGGTLAEANNATVHLYGVLTLAGGTLAGVAAPGGSALTYGTFDLDGGVVAGGVSATSTISANDVALTQPGGTKFTVNGGATSGIDLDVTGTLYHSGSTAISDTGLIKAGTGVMRLNGANTYTGSTRINAGALMLAGSASLASSSITVAPGAVFDVSKLTSGGISLASGQSVIAGKATGTTSDIVGNLNTGAGSLNVGGTGIAGTLTFNGDLTLGGGTVNLDLANSTTVGGGVNDLVTAGNLNLSGPTTFSINVLSGALTNGTYTLMAYNGSVTGSLSNLTATINGNALSSVRGSYTFGTSATSAGALTLTVSGLASLIWAGDGMSNVWDVTTTPNFSSNGSPDVFYQADSVTFDDSGSSTPAIAVTGTLRPASVTVNNSATAYTFGGTGSIAGPGALAKTGNGTLTIANANTYTGGTTLAAGQLNINNPSAIGTGPLVIAGGTIDNTSGAPITLSTNNAQTWSGDFAFGGTNSLNLGTGAVTLTANRTLTVNGTGTLTVGGGIAGAFGITKAGPGTLVLAGANAYTGNTTVNGGTLQVNSGTGSLAYSGGSIAINNGSTFQVNGYRYDFNGVNFMFDSNGGGTFDYSGTGGLGGLVFTGVNTFATSGGATDNLVASGVAGNYNLNGKSAVFNVSRGTDPVSDLTVSAILVNSSASPAITKTGNGILTLAGTNTYAGGTLVSAGTLAVSGSIAGSNAQVNGGVLQINNGGTVSSSTTTVAGGTVIVDGSLSGNTALVNGGTLQVNSDGTVSSTAATVTGGTFQANGTVSSPTTVSGGVLVGTGTMNGSVTVNAGGTLAPGQNGAGFLSLSNGLTLNSGGHLALTLSGTALGSQYSPAYVTGGSVTLGGDLQLSLGYTPAVGDIFYVLINGGSSAVNGVFSNAVNQGNGTGLMTVGADQFLVSYTASFASSSFMDANGQDIALKVIAIPEPGAFASLLAGFGMLAGLRGVRRRRS